MAGMFFAALCNLVAGSSLPVADFAFFGMAGVMAGAIQAPLTAMFLTVEMTGDFGMLLPLMLAAPVSFTMARLLTRRAGVQLQPSWIHRGFDRLVSRF